MVGLIKLSAKEKLQPTHPDGKWAAASYTAQCSSLQLSSCHYPAPSFKTCSSVTPSIEIFSLLMTLHLESPPSSASHHHHHHHNDVDKAFSMWVIIIMMVFTCASISNRVGRLCSKLT